MRADSRRRVHGGGKRRSGTRLLRQARPSRPRGRLHHGARDQPSLRRVDRRLVRRCVAWDGIARAGGADRARSRSRHADGRSAARHERRSRFPRGARHPLGRDQPGACPFAEGRARRRPGVLAPRSLDGTRRPAPPDRERILRCAPGRAIRRARRPLASPCRRYRRGRILFRRRTLRSGPAVRCRGYPRRKERSGKRTPRRSPSCARSPGVSRPGGAPR